MKSCSVAPCRVLDISSLVTQYCWLSHVRAPERQLKSCRLLNRSWPRLWRDTFERQGLGVVLAQKIAQAQKFEERQDKSELSGNMGPMRIMSHAHTQK